MSLLIKNGTVVTPSKIATAELHVENETTSAIGKGLIRRSEMSIDALRSCEAYLGTGDTFSRVD